MARKCFYSFHYKPDSVRAARVRSIGAIEGNQSAKDNDWESIVSGGESAIKRWIDNQLQGRTCTIVLIGENTAGRKWINYEITKSWNDGKGVLGIHIHNLVDFEGNFAKKGKNPFNFSLKNGKSMNDYVQVYDPKGQTSKEVYNYIANNIEAWVEKAIKIREEV